MDRIEIEKEGTGITAECMNQRIILCSNTLWSVVQFRSGVIRALTDQGFDVVCVGEANDFSGLTEKRVEDAGGRFIHLSMDRKGTNPLSDLVYLFRYLKILRDEKPALVINYTIKPVIYGSVATRLLRIPSFAVITGLGYIFTRENLLTHLTRKLYRFSLRFPHRVWFLNDDDREAFVKSRIIAPERAALLPGEGIDTHFYQPIPDQFPGADHAAFNKDGFVFLLVGRLLREKGIREYAEAARLVKTERGHQVRFRLVGFVDPANPGAISPEELHHWIEEGIIDYGGSTEDIRSEIAGSHCVVLPSYREGVPRTLLEGAAMGKPIIATDVPGCREVVDNGVNGFLCQPRNSMDLCEKMLRMIKLTPEEREKMGQAGREKVLREFDEKIITTIYLAEIGKVLRNNEGDTEKNH